MKDVEISVSTDGVSYNSLGIFQFSQAPGTNDYLGELISTADTAAQFVRFHVLSNYAGDFTFGVGLSEVQFFGAPPAAVVPEINDSAGTAVLARLSLFAPRFHSRARFFALG